MDETAWLGCVDPRPMLDYLFADRATRRKLRLLACACCRRWWGSLTDRRTQQAVHTCEHYAEGGSNRTALREAAQQAQLALYEAPQFETSAYYAVLHAAGDNIRRMIRPVLAALQQMARWQAAYECVLAMDEAAEVNAAMHLEQSAQCELIRELWGNPFRYLPFDEDWRCWQDGTVVKLARSIGDDRNWLDLPVLADALMDAGCTDERLLGHFRTTQGHSLGCWGLDRILGKE